MLLEQHGGAYNGDAQHISGRAHPAEPGLLKDAAAVIGQRKSGKNTDEEYRKGFRDMHCPFRMWSSLRMGKSAAFSMSSHPGTVSYTHLHTM